MSTALDSATLLGHLGRPADAVEWIRRAWDALAKVPQDSFEGGRVIQLRSARISTQLNEYDEAKALLDEIVRGSRLDRNPSTLIDALIARADIGRIQRRFTEAERDLQDALRLSDRMGIRGTRVLALLDLAMLHLERAAEADVAEAREAFGRALRQALALRPLHPRLAERLADEVLQHPELLHRTMTKKFSRELTQALATLKELTRPRILQQAERLRDRAHAAKRIADVLGHLRAGEIRLAHVSVYPHAEEVISSTGSRRIGAAEVEVLQQLLKAPAPGLTKQEVASELGIDLEAAKKRLARLKQTIGEDLISPRPGGPYVYCLAKRKVEP
jgi:tetratricopeptide (TPR) repeat protein